MIGGMVVEAVDLATKVYIRVVDRPYSRLEETTIYLERNENAVKVDVGDSIWWQGDNAMWTPHANNGRGKTQHGECGVDFDIQIPRRR